MAVQDLNPPLSKAAHKHVLKPRLKDARAAGLCGRRALKQKFKKKTRNRARNAMEERRQTAFSLEDIPDCS